MSGAPSAVHLRWVGATRVLTPLALFLGALSVPSTPELWAWVAVQVVADVAYLAWLLKRHPPTARFQSWQEWGLAALFILDVCVEAEIVAADGGLLSDFILLFVFTATLAGFIMRYRGAFWVTLSGFVVFGSLALSHAGFGAPGESLATLSHGTVLFRLLMVVGLGGTVSFLTAYLSEMLRRQRELSADQARDLLLARLDLDGVLNRLSYGVLVLDPSDKLLYFNQAASTILRHPLHPGARLQQVLSTETWGAELVEMAKSISTGLSGKTEKEFRISPTGWIQVQVAGQWIEGKLRNVVVALHDISGLRKMEEEVRSTERMATLGHMAARIAHEIRNPLASITGSAQLLGDMEGASDDDRQLLGLIRRESERLDRILTEFLDFSRPRSPSIRDLSVEEVLAEVKGMVETRLVRDGRSGIEVKVRCRAGLEAWLDHDMLVQILSNLAINGVQAIKEGHTGRIQIEVGADEEQIRFRIRDNGIGMAPDLLNKVGDAFFTTRQGGVGLGVAISRHLTTLLGGTFRIQSLEGRGTVVEVAFPQRENR
ncbi:MAG TPA: ATP-binding protein [Fibrobacteria bacterium]|nr:ATP-binding protein [Fibrobacteria bacterium]